MRSSLTIDFVLIFAKMMLEQKKGNAQIVKYIDKVQALKTLGTVSKDEINFHMEKIRDALLSGEKLDFKELIGRIDAEVDGLKAKATN